MRQDVDVCEVSCSSPVKQGEQLVAGQFFWRERRPSQSRGGGKVRRRVNGQVNQDSSINIAAGKPTGPASRRPLPLRVCLA
jgi:hypothetical protein